MVIELLIRNPSARKNLIVMSPEFDDLNKKVIKPGKEVLIAFKVPKGYREFVRSTSILGQLYIYIGCVDKDFPEPLLHEPNFS
jgi:hypothetical protein